MRYRATLHGIDESTQTQRQSHSGYRRVIEAWAEEVLAKTPSPDAYVQIEEQSWTIVRTIHKPGKCSYNHNTLRATSELDVCPECGEGV